MKQGPPVLAAVAFDFDGVIADTEPLHCRAFAEVLRPLGITLCWEEYRRHFLGYDDRDAFREIHRQANRPLPEAEVPVLVEAKADVFERLAKEGSAPLYPGVARLIGALRGKTPLALCSGALRRDIQPILARHGLQAVFDVMVTADEVAASKPDPASYVLARRRLAERHPDRTFEAGRCVAIEDTPAGIAAARGAGFRVLAVSTTYPPRALSAADRTVSSLADVSVEFIEQTAAGIVF